MVHFGAGMSAVAASPVDTVLVVDNRKLPVEPGNIVVDNTVDFVVSVAGPGGQAV